MGRTLAMGLALALVTGCGSSGEGSGSRSQNDKLICFVSVPPLAYFVERVGGEHVDVRVMVGPGQSPATYAPTPKQMARLTNSDVYFAVGVPFEARILPQIERAVPALEIVRTHLYHHVSASATRRASATSEGHRAGEHDPHVWLSPRLAQEIVRSIEQTLSRLDTAHAETYRKNALTLESDLDALTRDVRAALTPHDGKAMYVFHPAFDYLVGPFGIRQIAIEKGGAPPGSRHVATFIDSARSGRARVVFVQPQFSSTSAGNVAAAIGAELVTLDPLSRDYLNNVREMTARIDAALQDVRQQFSHRENHSTFN